MDIVEFVENVATVLNEPAIDERCKECKKDWTKCGRCPVSMEWVKEQKVRWKNDKRR